MWICEECSSSRVNSTGLIVIKAEEQAWRVWLLRFDGKRDGGSSHRSDTEMTAASSRERNSFWSLTGELIGSQWWKVSIPTVIWTELTLKYPNYLLETSITVINTHLNMPDVDVKLCKSLTGDRSLVLTLTCLWILLYLAVWPSLISTLYLLRFNYSGWPHWFE